jgi:hypothetical protein
VFHNINHLKPEIMKAIILKGLGGVENLVITSVYIPDVSDNEVLVQVKAKPN